MIISPEWILLALQIVLCCVALLAVAYVFEWGINWLDRRDAARRQRPRYSTADAKRIEREVDQLWRGAWRDTMPPAPPPTKRMPAYPLRDNQQPEARR